MYVGYLIKYVSGTQQTATFIDTSSSMEQLQLSSATLTRESGKSGSLSISVPVTHQTYALWTKLKTYVELYEDNELIFFGRVYTIQQDFQKNLLIECEGILSVLHDSMYRPTVHEASLQSLVTDIIVSHNQQVSSDKQIVVGTIEYSDELAYREYDDYATSLSRLEDLVSSYGGKIELAKTNNGLVFNWRNPDNFPTSNQTIEFAENLLDINYVENSDYISTILVPIGGEVDIETEEEQTTEEGETITVTNLTRKTIDLTELPLQTVTLDGHTIVHPANADYIVDQTGVAEYGEIVTKKEWTDVYEPANLFSKAAKHILTCTKPKLSISAKAVDLANAGYDVSRFKLNTKIRVVSEPHGFDRVCTINKIDTDLYDRSQNSISLNEEIEGYISRTRNAANDAYSLIQKVYKNYAINETVKKLVTTESIHSTEITQNSEQILLRATITDTQTWIEEGTGHAIEVSQTYTNSQIAIEAGKIQLLVESMNYENMVPFPYYRYEASGNPYTANGITWTVNSDNTITATGTASGTATYHMSLQDGNDGYYSERFQIPSGVYALSGCPEGGGSSTYQVYIDLYTSSSGSRADRYIDTGLAEGATFEITQTMYARIYITIASGYAIGSLGRTFKVQLERGRVAHPYRNPAYGANRLVSEINLTPDQIKIRAEKINLEGAVSFNSLNSTLQGTINNTATGSSSKMQYGLSSSTSSPPSTWYDSPNSFNWSTGSYIWTRTATTVTNTAGTSATTYSTAVYDKQLTKALVDAATASTDASTAYSKAEEALASSTGSKQHYGTCGTAASTQTKVVACSDFVIYTGAQITVKFTYGNTATHPILNVNGTGGHYVYVNGSYMTSYYYWKADDVLTFTYDGSHWVMDSTQAMHILATWCDDTDTTLIDGGMLAAGSVTANKIYATNLESIAASIGGFTIANNQIRSGTLSNAGICLASVNQSSSITIAGHADTTWRLGLGSNFGVTSNGAVYASSLHVSQSASKDNAVIDVWTSTSTSVERWRTFMMSGRLGVYRYAANSSSPSNRIAFAYSPSGVQLEKNGDPVSLVTNFISYTNRNYSQWFYRTWDNGFSEAWYQLVIDSEADWYGTWGTLKYFKRDSFSFPSGLFTNRPNINISVSAAAGAAWGVGDTNTQSNTATGDIYIYSATAVDRRIYVNIYASGY